MPIKTITMARLFNTGDYEHQRIELSFELETDDDPVRVQELMTRYLEACRPNSPVTECAVDGAREWVLKSYEQKVEYVKRNYGGVMTDGGVDGVIKMRDEAEGKILSTYNKWAEDFAFRGIFLNQLNNRNSML